MQLFKDAELDALRNENEVLQTNLNEKTRALAASEGDLTRTLEDLNLLESERLKLRSDLKK